VLEHRAEIEARAAALSKRQDAPGADAKGDAPAADLVESGVAKGGSDVGEGNH
jgi:hypothetical protein